MKKLRKPGIFNPKRKLRDRFPEAGREELADRVSYGGNPEHKRNPGDFGLAPPSIPRPDKTLCDGCGIFRKAEALELLKAGVCRGLVSAAEVKGYPKSICSVTDSGIALKVQLEDSEPTDDFIEETADHFEASPLCVHTALVNHGKLPLESLERFS